MESPGTPMMCHMAERRILSANVGVFVYKNRYNHQMTWKIKFKVKFKVTTCINLISTPIDSNMADVYKGYIFVFFKKHEVENSCVFLPVQTFSLGSVCIANVNIRRLHFVIDVI